ncbi:unnamed protein product [Gordionus sp. m RMFG-2023]
MLSKYFLLITITVLIQGHFGQIHNSGPRDYAGAIPNQPYGFQWTNAPIVYSYYYGDELNCTNSNRLYGILCRESKIYTL